MPEESQRKINTFVAWLVVPFGWLTGISGLLAGWYLIWIDELKPAGKTPAETVAYGEPMFWVCAAVFGAETLLALIVALGNLALPRPQQITVPFLIIFATAAGLFGYLLVDAGAV